MRKDIKSSQTCTPQIEGAKSLKVGRVGCWFGTVCAERIQLVVVKAATRCPAYFIFRPKKIGSLGVATCVFLVSSIPFLISPGNHVRRNHDSSRAEVRISVLQELPG